MTKVANEIAGNVIVNGERFEVYMEKRAKGVLRVDFEAQKQRAVYEAAVNIVQKCQKEQDEISRV